MTIPRLRAMRPTRRDCDVHVADGTAAGSAAGACTMGSAASVASRLAGEVVNLRVDDGPEQDGREEGPATGAARTALGVPASPSLAKADSSSGVWRGMMASLVMTATKLVPYRSPCSDRMRCRAEDEGEDDAQAMAVDAKRWLPLRGCSVGVSPRLAPPRPPPVEPPFATWRLLRFISTFRQTHTSKHSHHLPLAAHTTTSVSSAQPAR